MTATTPGPFDVETVSGQYVSLLAPDPATIRLSDIAWHLATQNRFLGAARRPISVAEHALLVAARLAEQGAPPAVVLAGLHHDDHETYMGDICRAVKNYVAAHGSAGDGLELLASRLDAAIEVALELPAIDASAAERVKAADDWALACEAYHLLPSRGRGWGVHGLYVNERGRETPGVRRLALHSPTTHHALAAEWRSTHNRWMRLHDATLTPTPKEPIS